jgi:hypothetical protein
MEERALKLVCRLSHEDGTRRSFKDLAARTVLQSRSMSVNDLPSRRRSRAGRISDRPIAAPPLASKMAPSPANQVYAPPGWPVTPLPTNVSLEDLPTTDPHCTNDTCKAFMDGFAESERIAPLLSQLEYATWTVWFYSFWIFAFAVIHLCHIFRDHIPPRKRESPRHCSSWIHKLVALGRSITYRQLNGRFGEAIGPRQTSFRVLLLLAFSTIFSLSYLFHEMYTFGHDSDSDRRPYQYAAPSSSRSCLQALHRMRTTF